MSCAIPKKTLHKHEGCFCSPAVLVDADGTQTKIWYCSDCGTFYEVPKDASEMLVWEALYHHKGTKDG